MTPRYLCAAASAILLAASPSLVQAQADPGNVAHAEVGPAPTPQSPAATGATPPGAGDLGHIDLKRAELEWQLVEEHSKEPGFDQAKVWDAVKQMLDRASKRVNELSMDKAYTTAPVINVTIDELPSSGMAVEDVKDPTIRAKYQAAIKENNLRMANATYRIAWYRLFKRMSVEARSYVHSLCSFT